MGKNGAFVEEEWVECGSTWLLHKEGGHVKPSGEKAWRIQIGGVGFALIFPPRDPLENEKFGVAAAGKEGEEGMSLEFLDGSNSRKDDEDEDEDVEEEDVDSDLEAEENAYALAPSAEDLSENDSLDGYEEDDEAFLERDEEGDEDEDEEEDEEEAEDINNLDEDIDEELDDDEDEEGEEAEGDDGEASSSSEDEDDGDDYISGPARKRKKPSPQRHKPIARKNIKMLEALKRPKYSPEVEKRGRGRPKKTVAEKSIKAVFKKPMKGPLKKQHTEQQGTQERLRKLREEEAEERGMLRERELLKEKQLRDALRSKALQKSLGEVEKAAKIRQEAEKQEKGERAAAQAKRKAQDAAAESARRNAKIQLPTILPSEASTAAPGTALAPFNFLQLQLQPKQLLIHLRNLLAALLSQGQTYPNTINLRNLQRPQATMIIVISHGPFA
ncbi:hypothetical protein BGX38DRAFT_1281351 [Terfezia claveryi]|nr:hypothetical protein BGX38DRAFT_1281351 [Terfezia claveryi]